MYLHANAKGEQQFVAAGAGGAVVRDEAMAEARPTGSNLGCRGNV